MNSGCHATGSSPSGPRSKGFRSHSTPSPSRLRTWSGHLRGAGPGFDRLCWRDTRTKEQLNAIGIYAHPTDNVVHRGDPEITVAQGNHFVNVQSNGTPELWARTRGASRPVEVVVAARAQSAEHGPCL